MEVLYDKSQKRLLYFKKMGDTFWDRVWDKKDIETTCQNLSRFNLVNRITKRYLKPEDGPVLEGGCGLGQYVYSLTKAGYDCIGVDLAKKTVSKIKETYPYLKIEAMDVRKLGFSDNCFAGYWSLGVIEHFYDDCDEIVCEMQRVLKPNGYLFLTVPTMSPLRKLKAELGLYPQRHNQDKIISDFYQFVFNPKDVTANLEYKGFKLIKTEPYDGIKGLKDEVVILKHCLQYIYDSQKLPLKLLKRTLDITLKHFTNHMCLFIMQKVT